MAWRTAPVIGARDVKATADYFCSKLGFECPGGPIGGVGDEGPVYAVLNRRGAQLHVQIRRHAIWGDDRGEIERSAYVYVDDVDDLHQEFEQSDARITQPPTEMPYGLHEMVVEDPEGHRIAFGSEPGRKDLHVWEAAPILGTQDVGATKDWFCDALGFACPGGVFQPEGHDPVYAIVFREQAGIHLQIRRRRVFPVERESIEGDGTVFVDDVDALHAEYAARDDVRVVREPLDEPYGLRDFIIATPLGHRLGFASPL